MKLAVMKHEEYLYCNNVRKNNPYTHIAKQNLATHRRKLIFCFLLRIQTAVYLKHFEQTRIYQVKNNLLFLHASLPFSHWMSEWNAGADILMLQVWITALDGPPFLKRNLLCAFTSVLWQAKTTMLAENFSFPTFFTLQAFLRRGCIFLSVFI